ncbi:MAG: mono/diheme cytochrome c family protein [Myxococcota bacterium]|jgi:mono/diheme cytochrome c family protein
MSIWIWFVIASGLVLVFRTIEKTAPHRATSARRIGTTVVLTTLGLAVTHAVYLRDSNAVRIHYTVAARVTALHAEAAINRQLRRVERDAQIDRRTPVIRKRLLVAAYSGETGMYEGRAAFIARCGGCHGEDGGGVPDQSQSPAIIGLGERDREDLIPYLSVEHPLPYAGVIEAEELVQIETFLWAGLLEVLPE